MIVTKPGIPDEEHTFKGTCRLCKAEVKYRRSETEYGFTRLFGDPIRIAKCPTCESWMTVTDGPDMAEVMAGFRKSTEECERMLAELEAARSGHGQLLRKEEE